MDRKKYIWMVGWMDIYEKYPYGMDEIEKKMDGWMDGQKK